MIIGIGTDICSINRIEGTLAKFGCRFKKRIFSIEEQKKAESRRNPAATYAKFFAAKEACSKALGTGFREGVYWKDLHVKSLKTGQPFMEVSGGALKKLNKLTPANMHAVINLSLTDEYPLAHAMVVICANLIETEQ